MMQNVPIYVNLTFLAVVVAVLAFLFYALNRAAPERTDFTPTIVITFLLVWLFIIVLLAYSNFLSDTSGFPPRLFLLVAPSIITIIAVFSIKKSRIFLLKMPLTTLTFIHIVRVPVEIVIFWLASYQLMPVEMTFEGSNLDILSGITAPFAGIFLVGMRSKSRYGAIIWNLLALGLLINVVSRAIAATPYFYSPDSMDHANVAVLYFPYLFLPTLVVPLVLFSHLVCLYKLFSSSIHEDHF
jgi:hypothetical protein